MRMLAIIAFLLMVVLVCWAVHIQWTAWRHSYVEDHGEWQVKQRWMPGRRLGIFLISPTGEEELFGEPISQQLSEYEFEDLRTERLIGAQVRADTLNRKLLP